MLVLSRKKDEVLRIGDEVIVKVLEVRGGVVRLGIEAPDHINIVRSELLPGEDSKRDYGAGTYAGIAR